MAAFTAVAAIVLIFVFVAKEALPLFYDHEVRSEVTPSKMWFSQQWEHYDQPEHIWQPVSDVAKYAIWPLIVGTLKVVIVAMLFGVPLAIGSDGPNNPFLNLMLAVIHPTHPDEALTMEQAVTAYTRGSAWAEFTEREKGTLAPGMLADIAVLSQDIFTVPPPALPATVSVLTLVGGEIAHDALTRPAN